MNKIFAIILLVLLVNIYDVNTASCNKQEVSDPELCYYMKLSGTETHCCAVEYAEDKYRCEGLTDDQYENIKRYKDYRRNNVVDNLPLYDDLGIDCSSEFVSFSILALIAFLL